jgi:hypothetical protein
MIRRSQRLRRLLRKYALDARLARIAQAKAERERDHLAATEGRIKAAQSALARSAACPTGGELAALGEWSDRLVQAGASLKPAIERVTVDCGEASLAVRRAKGRMEKVEERISQAIRTEERQSSARSEVRTVRPGTGWNQKR